MRRGKELHNMEGLVQTAPTTDNAEKAEAVVLLTTVKEIQAKAKDEHVEGSKEGLGPAKKTGLAPKPEAKGESVKKTKTVTDLGAGAEQTAKAEHATRPGAKAEPIKKVGPAQKPEAKQEQATRAKPVPKPEMRPEDKPGLKEPPSGSPSAPNPPVLMEKAQEGKAEEVPAQIVESPLKRMRQEFNERAGLIRREMRNIQNSFLMIGFQLHWIKENKMYRILDYKNICDYAEKEYGIKKSTCCNFINIIENYAERDEDGNVIESITECYRNFSSSQLLAMIGMPEDMQKQVTPDTPVRVIQQMKKGGTESPAVADAPNVVITDARGFGAGKPAPMDAVKPTVDGPAPKAPAAVRPIGMEPTPTAVGPAGTRHPLPVVEPGTPPKARESLDKREKEAPAPVAKSTVPSMGKAKRPGDGHTAEKDTKMPAGDTAKASVAPMAANPTGKKGTVELAELDSYNDYKDMQDKLALMMKSVFSRDDTVRVKIVCVYG